jgi:hypothetical protein
MAKLTISDAARACGVARTTIQRTVKTGRLSLDAEHQVQELRGCSYLLQGWQCELSALEDEAPLELPPGASLVKTFTFHQHIRHQTSSNMMTLLPFFGGKSGLPRARVSSLTGLQAQLALQHLVHRGV